jgi:hypothetical protein
MLVQVRRHRDIHASEIGSRLSFIGKGVITMPQRVSPKYLAATTTGLGTDFTAALRWPALRIVVMAGVTLLGLAAAPTASAATPCCGVTNITKDGLITAKETKGARTFQFQVANTVLRSKLRVGVPVYANFDTKQVSLDGKKSCCKILNIFTAAKQAVPGTGPVAAGSITTQSVPHPLKSLRFDPFVAGGNRVQGHVELVQPPGPNGVKVTLESSDPQLAAVPAQVTVTGGVTSAETGPMYMASFPIDTRPVPEANSVTIKARAGAQTLEANLRIIPPKVKSASLHPPSICDGHNKAKLTYTLTGPAPSGLKVSAKVNVSYSDTGGSSSGSANKSETVPTGKTGGSMRIAPPRCHAHNPGQRCQISGSASISGSGSGVSTSVGSCGHPPD